MRPVFAFSGHTHCPQLMPRFPAPVYSMALMGTECDSAGLVEKPTQHGRAASSCPGLVIRYIGPVHTGRHSGGSRNPDILNNFTQFWTQGLRRGDTRQDILPMALIMLRIFDSGHSHDRPP